MQQQLQQVCMESTIPPPMYSLHEVKHVNGVQYRNYYACLAPGAMETPVVCSGRFAKHEYDVKQDVAAQLLQKLLGGTGKQIRDYNYYNYLRLESMFNDTISENQ